MRLLIVEDNERLSTLVAAGLGRHGFVCDPVPDIRSADAALSIALYDALIVDLGLPDGDGVDWLSKLRRAGQMVPAIILTARDALQDRVTGLDAGADDYVVKPIEIDELAARVRALLRRPGPRAQTMLDCGPLLFDSATRVAQWKTAPLSLSRREADLLELLLRRVGTVVRRSAIEQALYSFDEAVTPNAVEANVSRLRRKLEDAGANSLLHTVRGVGYMIKAA